MQPESSQTRSELLKFLESDQAVWKDQHHPELHEGPSAWVSALRQESEQRTFPITRAPSM